MPVADVIVIAIYLVEHQDLPNTHLWLDEKGATSHFINTPRSRPALKSPDLGIPI